MSARNTTSRSPMGLLLASPYPQQIRAIKNFNIYQSCLVHQIKPTIRGFRVFFFELDEPAPELIWSARPTAKVVHPEVLTWPRDATHFPHHFQFIQVAEGAFGDDDIEGELPKRKEMTVAANPSNGQPPTFGLLVGTN